MTTKSKRAMRKWQKKRRNRRSNFFLTINTNQHFNQHSQEYEQFNNKFKQSLNDIYNNLGDYLKIKEQNDNFDNNVEDVDIKSATEIGSKTGKVHVHVSFNIKHNTLLQLDYDKIKTKIQNDLQLQNIYLNNKVFWNNSATLESYIAKYYS